MTEQKGDACVSEKTSFWKGFADLGVDPLDFLCTNRPSEVTETEAGFVL